jgi:hypothetical protein
MKTTCNFISRFIKEKTRQHLSELYINQSKQLAILSAVSVKEKATEHPNELYILHVYLMKMILAILPEVSYALYKGKLIPGEN